MNTKPKSRPKLVQKIVGLSGRWKDKQPPFQMIQPDQFSFGLALTRIRTNRGTIEASVSLDSTANGASAGVVFGYDAKNSTGICLNVGGFDAAYSIGAFTLGQGAHALAKGGTSSGLTPKRWYDITASLQGLVLSLQVDGAEVLAHTLPAPLSGDQVGLFGYGDCKAQFKGVRIDPAAREAFVVMPFDPQYDSLWKEVIGPVCVQSGYHPYRADDVYKPGIILEDIVSGLKSADVVIAEVGDHNPNVFYELGYAHAVGTPVIMMAERKQFEEKKLPFDIGGYRCIIYSDAIRGKREVEDALRSFLKGLKRS